MQNYIIIYKWWFLDCLIVFWFCDTSEKRRQITDSGYSCTLALHIYNTKTRKTRTAVSKWSVGLKYANYKRFTTDWSSVGYRIQQRKGLLPTVIPYLLGYETIAFMQQRRCRFGATTNESHWNSTRMAVRYIINLTVMAHQSQFNTSSITVRFLICCASIPYLSCFHRHSAALRELFT